MTPESIEALSMLDEVPKRARVPLKAHEGTVWEQAAYYRYRAKQGCSGIE